MFGSSRFRPCCAHLDLPADQGLYVSDLVAEGPAAAAGLKQHDILLELKGQPLKEPAELAAAVEKSEGKPVVLKVFRGARA